MSHSLSNIYGKSMSALPKIFIVILNWNGSQVLLPCLRSVFSLAYTNFEVVVVDNASTDGSFESARSHFSRAHFIRNEKNIGFAAGMNIGMKFALSKGAQYVWILNNDTLCGKDSLRELVSAIQKERNNAILSPLILTPLGKTWFSFGKIDFFRMKALHTDPPVHAQENTPYESGYLSGCAMFFPKRVLQKIGFFDERYFLYYEDADISIRAKNAEIKLFIVPKAVVVHGEQSEKSQKKTYFLVLSGLRFFDLHAPRLLRPWIKLYILLRKVKNRRDRYVRGDETALLVSKAYADYASGKKSDLLSRLR